MNFKILSLLFLFNFTFLVSKSQDYNVVTLLNGIPSPVGLYDFDGDNDLDLLCKNYEQGLGSPIWWIENVGNNVFKTIHNSMSAYNSPGSALSDRITVADLDNDSDLDMLLHQGYNTSQFGLSYGKLYYYQNDGSGNFYPFGTSSDFHSYCVADLDEDNVAEIYGSYNLSIYNIEFNGDELLSTVIYTGTSNGYGERYIELTSADINNDGQPDLAYINKDLLYGDNSRDYIEAILNTNASSWTPTVLMSGQTGSSTNYDFTDIYYFELVDSDNDNDLDLYFNLLADNGYGDQNNSLNMKLNDGSGVFGNFCDSPNNGLNLTSSHNVAYDFDANNIPDFLSIHNNYSGPSSFNMHQNFGCETTGITTAGYMPFSLDYNGDGNLDLFKSIYIQNTTTFIYYLDHIEVYHGDGNGNFTLSTTIFQIESPTNDSNSTGYPAADFDNNGSVDLINLENWEFQQINTNVNGYAMSQTDGALSANTSGQFWKCAHMNNNNFVDLVYMASDANTSNPPRDVYIKPNINGQLTGNTILAFDNTSNPTNSYTRGFNIADTDNDGDQDILVYYKKLSQNDGKIYLIRNQGNFSFAAAVALTPAFGQDYYAELVVLDYDNDGDSDLFMYGKFFRNNGNNNFTEQYTTDITCDNCEFADVDLDGDLDVMSKNINNYFQTLLYINQGNFSFTNTQTFDLGNNGSRIFKYDFDGDGVVEFISEDNLLKKENASDPQYTIIGEIAPIQSITTLPDGRNVTWIAPDGYAVNQISYDFINGVNCLGITPVVTEFNDVLSTTPPGVNYQWYDCSNNSLVEGANNGNFSPASEGSYRVQYSAGTCPLVSNCIEVQFMPGDFNSDNVVNVSDLLLLLANFGCTGPDCPMDLDDNGSTGSSDIMLFLGLITE